MKKYWILFILVLLTGFARTQEKVTWVVRYNAATNEVEFKATIADGWHLYSQHISNEIGPVPTTFLFNENATISWSGAVTEPTPIQEYDPNFEATLNFFKNEVIFKRKLAPGSKGVITGVITYMVCNDIMCLPPSDLPFSITLP
jgi:hypothetical protein